MIDHTKKKELCDCGFPQSYPTPHEHSKSLCGALIHVGFEGSTTCANEKPCKMHDLCAVCSHGRCHNCHSCHNPDCEHCNTPMKGCYDQLLPKRSARNPDDNTAKHQVDGVTSPHLNEQSHGGKSRPQGSPNTAPKHSHLPDEDCDVSCTHERKGVRKSAEEECDCSEVHENIGGKDGCGCACHQDPLKKPQGYLHDTQCCPDMNGTLVAYERDESNGYASVTRNWPVEKARFAKKIMDLATDHYWDTFEADKLLILKHLGTIVNIALEPRE